MATIRNKFHELGNCLHKISVSVLVDVEMLKDIDLAKTPQKELAETLDFTIKSLEKVAGFVKDADEAITCMKPFIYEKLGGDTEILIKPPEGRK